MRAPELQKFLDLTTTAMQALPATNTRATTACARAIALWQGHEGKVCMAAPCALPVCDWLDPALALASSGPRSDLAAAFAVLSSRLQWRRRGSADPADNAFWNGHANALIIGPDGLEDRADIWVGATIMAPGVTYADHDHPPEEVYLSLTPGEWWNTEMDWTDPGPQGAIYNPPGIRHRMRSGSGPFLALWYLPV